jgi:hypothetical protein
MTHALHPTTAVLAHGAEPPHPLAASFFQPVYADWPTRLDGSWATWMARLRRCGVRRLIVQNLAHLSMAGGVAADAPVHDILLGSAQSTLYGLLGGWADADALLEAAHARQIQVDVGLSLFVPQPLCGADGQPGPVPGCSWAWLSQDATAEQLAPWLARAAEADQRIAAAWHQRYGTRQGAHAAWRGWYLANEIDDRSWRQAGCRPLWLAHLQDRIEQLRRLDLAQPRPVAVSGFANVDTPLNTVAQQWHDWLADLRVDEVLFQDTIGAKQQPTQRVAALYARVSAVAAAHGRCFTPVVELFRDEGARSARVAEAEEGLALAAAAASRGAQDEPPGWVCFDVPNNVIGQRPGAEDLRSRFETAD